MPTKENINSLICTLCDGEEICIFDKNPGESHGMCMNQLKRVEKLLKFKFWNGLTLLEMINQTTKTSQTGE